MRAHFRCGAKRTRNSLSASAVSCREAWFIRARLLTLVFRLVQPVDNDISLGDAQRVEVLPHCQRQLIFVHPPFRLFACHCWREAPNALAEHDVAEWVLEGRRRVEAVCSSVALQD
jgi:hypothetical protein